MAQAYGFPDNDCDSAFGEDSFCWTPSPPSMLTPPSAPLAGSKRDAAIFYNDRSAAPGQGGIPEHRAEHIDPQALRCCGVCPEQPPRASVTDSRPSKRRAVAKGSAFHGPPLADSGVKSIPGQQFPDDGLFDKFCCDLNAPCVSPCALPCPDEDCPSPHAACDDPRCEQACDQDCCARQQCADDCNDPECTKISCPDDPCFCQDCHAQPCPLGDPNNECHQAHSAPTDSGTIWCYDTNCHFQTGYHFTDPNLEAFNSYPCFSESHHETLAQCNVTNPTSSVDTPGLSPYTSLGSLSHQPSRLPGSQTIQPCSLNIPSAHCHFPPDNCCHGPSRGHEELPKDFQFDFNIWNPTLTQGSGLEDALMNFAFNPASHGGPLSIAPPTSTSASSLDNGYQNNMYRFDNSAWMPANTQYSAPFSSSDLGSNLSLDYLASAARQDVHQPSNAFLDGDTLRSSALSTPVVRPMTSTSTTSTGTDFCVCKWEVSPGVTCGELCFSAESLHKHLKTAHVENCTSCLCHWQGCEACGKDFKQRSKLSRHLLGHAGYRPYPCSFAGCTKTFATNQARENHERVHTGDKPYACDQCDYRTTTHTQLQTHIAALHMKKKIHKCRFCDFTCADSSNLSKHERTHQDLRPYRCPHPGCTFKPDCRWENLKRHLRRSNHCPELLIEGSVENIKYREGVQQETEEWKRRKESGEVVVARRRKGPKNRTEMAPFATVTS